MAMAASQCSAAFQRLRHNSHASAAADANPSTGALPMPAKVAMARSANGLRSENISAYTLVVQPQWAAFAERETLNHVHNHATANRQSASNTKGAVSGRRRSIKAPTWRRKRGCA